MGSRRGFIRKTTLPRSVKPGFMCYKQGTHLGEAVRNYIVEQVRPMDPARVIEAPGIAR